MIFPQSLLTKVYSRRGSTVLRRRLKPFYRRRKSRGLDLKHTKEVDKMAHTKKYILEHYECDGQLSIDDLPFQGENVDNFVTDVDNIPMSYPTECDICCREECVGCKLSDPDMYAADRERLNCLADYRFG